MQGTLGSQRAEDSGPSTGKRPSTLGRGGAGLAGVHREDGEIDDARLSRMLPALRSEDYYVEPSLQQLAAMGRDDPASLAAVSSFVVGRRGFGCVRWLEPVDVRGLDVEGVVSITKGSLEVRAGHAGQICMYSC